MIKYKIILKKIIYIFIAIVFFQNSSFAKDIYEITAKKVTYDDNENIITAEGDALAVNSLGKKLSSDKMVYNKNQNLIQTFGSSKFEDGKIILTANNFKYDIEIKTIEAIKNVVLVDKEKNNYQFSFVQPGL
jgi:lipopolysaccharide assembly outer membrane protein LptD (OstA)